MSAVIDDWVKRNAGKISLYWRGRYARLISLSCPLCGKPLMRVRGKCIKGKFICRNKGCRLLEVRLSSGFVMVYIEPFLVLKYRLFKVWCEQEYAEKIWGAR